MKVLMVGATGANAGLVLPELIERGVTVRALVQDQRRGQAARQRGASETAIGDLGDAAYHPSISAMVNHAAKQPVEEALYESSLDFTVLQPSMFMQNLAGAWNAVAQHGRLSMPYSKHAKVCWVDYRDVAEAAALAMTGDELSHGTFELSAPGMVDRVELAALASQVLGLPVEAGEVPREQWAAQLPEGLLREGLARMMAHYDEHGFPGGNALVLRAILGREPRTLEQYFGELAVRSAGPGSSR